MTAQHIIQCLVPGKRCSVRDHPCARDVTYQAQLLEQARVAVAVGYSALTRPRRNIRDIYASVCRDAYDEDQRTRTIATFARDAVTGRDEVSGTVRIILGRRLSEPSRLMPIDAMNLFTVPTWPHRVAGVSDEHIAELSRFTIARQARTPVGSDWDDACAITRALFDKAVEIACAEQITYLYAIMPGHVVRLVRRAGICLQAIDGAMRQESDEVARLMRDFPTYWTRPLTVYRIGFDCSGIITRPA